MKVSKKQLELLKEVTLLCKKKEPSRSKLNEVRYVIIFLKRNNYTLQEMAAYLKERDIKTTSANISYYLKRYPITEEEFLEAESNYDNIKKEAILERNKKLADKLRGKKT
jgi:hypothetical protein